MSIIDQMTPHLSCFGTHHPELYKRDGTCLDGAITSLERCTEFDVSVDTFYMKREFLPLSLFKDI